VKKLFLLLFLVVITDPYRSLDYDEINVYIIDEELPYQIKVYGPEPNKHETEYTDSEIDRFIRKAKQIINYPSYVYER